MSQQTLRQQARRAAREAAGRRQRERAERERRVIATAERIIVTVAERDAVVALADLRAGEALNELTNEEGLSLREALEWCAGVVTLREATRLRRLAEEQKAGGSSPSDFTSQAPAAGGEVVS